MNIKHSRILHTLCSIFLFLNACTSYNTTNKNTYANKQYIQPSSPQQIHLSPHEAKKVGYKIWQNESGASVAGLTVWNEGEDFPSLGIGHFIWQPKNSSSIFGESFPSLIKFMHEKQASIPKWLLQAKHAPWSSRTQFLASQNSQQMIELRNFLLNTIDLQTQFIVQRLQDALPKIVLAAPDTQTRQKIIQNFYAVAQSPAGVYALIDYVNFKGEGIGNPPQYNNQGWGLRQVLTQMKTSTNNEPYKSLVAFSNAVKYVLSRRVKNAPQGRDETRWLKGWHNRANTYIAEY